MSSSKVANDLELDLTRIYKAINKEYKSITREMIDEIIRKFDDFADVYINNSHLTTKENSFDATAIEVEKGPFKSNKRVVPPSFVR